MQLTKNKLFSGILLFGLTTIILVLFNIQYFYLRAIFSFIFLTTIPGLLIMIMLKIRKIELWEYLVYTIGLSIAFLMFAGLAVNWILPWLHITDKPLSLMPLILSFDIILSILGFIAYKRNKKISLKIKIPKVSRINKVFFVAPIIFTILSILGAITLNNGGPNYLTMVMLGGITVYIFLTALLRDKLNEHVFPWAILMISLSLLLTYSLRSWYISGSDINEEYLVFQLTKYLSIWHIFPVQQIYSTCLSLTILPTILSNFININDNYIYKVLFQIIGSITPVVVYLITKKYTTAIISFISAIFFVSYPSYFFILPMHIRTEIGFMFFSLSVLVLLSKNNISFRKTLLFLIFSASLVVSHYSSNYIALAIFISTYILFNLVKYILNFNNKKSKKRIVTLFTKGHINLKLNMILIFALFTLLWQVQITPSSNNIFTFLNETFSNISNIFSQDVRSYEGNLGYQLFLFQKTEDKSFILNKYIKSVTNNSNDGNSIAVSDDLLPLKFNQSFSSIIYLIYSLNNKLVKFMIIIGALYICWMSMKNRKIDLEYPIINLMGLFLIIAILLLPFASIEYSIDRTFQQILIFAAGPTIMICFFVLRKMNTKISLIMVTTIFLSYFLFNTGFITQLIGGSTPSANLNNYGSDFDRFYVYNQEVNSITWLSGNYDKSFKIISDNAGVKKIEAFGGVGNVNSVGLIIPQIINRTSYVYLTETNTVKNVGYAWIQGQVIKYNIPLAYINNNKNLIYSSGSNKIFK